MERRRAPTEFQSHPKGLYILFGTEAWERFSYFGMRAILTLYLVNHLRYTRHDALALYGTYTGLVYLTPILGGYLADKWLGRRKPVLIGGLLMTLGHLAMAFEALLFVALGLLAVGNGFFKPNISTIVGGLYRDEDARRDSGFTVFYMGINLGAFLAPIVCGTLGEQLGWHLGFGVAALGMSVGVGLFAWGQRHLQAVGVAPSPSQASTSMFTKRDYVEVVLWVLGGTLLVCGIVLGWMLVGPVLSRVGWMARGSLGLVLAGCVGYQLFKGTSHDEAKRLAVVVILCLFNSIFWVGLEQAGGTMTLFADYQTDRTLSPIGVATVALAQIAAGLSIWFSTHREASGRALWVSVSLGFILAGLATAIFWSRSLFESARVEFNASHFQAISPLIAVALAPGLSRMWLRLDQGRCRTSAPTKMAIGLIILGLGFILMYIGGNLAAVEKVGPGWLATVYLLHTIGELCFSPIGLSTVTKLAPERVVSLTMGLWFLSAAVANYVAGTLEGRLEAYEIPVYGFLVATSIGSALLLLALAPLLTRWMRGRLHP